MAEIIAPSKKETVRATLKNQRDKCREKVKGIFKFYEVPGGTMSFVYKAFKEDEIERYDLTDGQVYELPLGVAKHLNKNGWYPVHAYAMDENGTPSQKVSRKERRFGFQSLEFIDNDDLNEVGSGIVTVENISGR